MLFIFYIYKLNLVLIGCNLPFDLLIYILCIILKLEKKKKKPHLKFNILIDEIVSMFYMHLKYKKIM